MLSSTARCFLSVRAGLGASALALAGLLGGCAAEADEQPGAQYPAGPPPVAEPAPTADATGVLYGMPEPATAGSVNDPMAGVPDPAGPASDDYADTDPSALTDFHAALDPYGQWVEDPSYGTIWQPSPGVVGSDFAPYETNGYWSYGDSYVWVSGYSWGWAPFHYGRWVYATNGWGWIPGRQYAGAWTTWRTGYGPYAGYVGWAPLPPTWYWRGGMAVGIGVVPPAAYGFCSTGNLFASSLGGRMVAGPQVAALGQYSQPVMHGGSGAGVARGMGGSGPSGGRTLANPQVAGPSPASLHIASEAVVRPPSNNAGLARATQFAHPSTAMALGAHGPAGAPMASRAAPTRGWTAGQPRPSRAIGASRGPAAYGSYNGAFRAQSRTIGGGGGAWESPHYAGRPGTTFHGGQSFGPYTMHHGPGVHGGVAPAPQYQPPAYGEGYHPNGSGGGHFGGHGGGGRGGGGGRR
jgi:hypothetical protein